MSAVKKIGQSMIAAIIGMIAIVSPISLSTANAHEPYFRDAPSSECHDEKMLKRIVKRFRIQAR